MIGRRGKIDFSNLTFFQKGSKSSICVPGLSEFPSLIRPFYAHDSSQEVNSGPWGHAREKRANSGSGGQN